MPRYPSAITLLKFMSRCGKYSLGDYTIGHVLAMALLTGSRRSHERPTPHLGRASDNEGRGFESVRADPRHLAGEIRMASPRREAVNNHLWFRRLIDPSGELSDDEDFHKFGHRVPGFPTSVSAFYL